MTISSDKTRTMLTLSKETKKAAQRQAEEENRSLNNLIETALLEYLKKV
jgi:predicted HicB family RNase H-like nuclease